MNTIIKLCSFITVLLFSCNLNAATIAPCDTHFESMLAQQQIHQIEQHLGNGSKSGEGEVAIWYNKNTSLLVARMEKDVTVSITPDESKAPTPFKEVLHNAQDTNLQKIIAKLGPPQITHQLKYYTWTCLNTDNHIKLSRLVVDENGNVWRRSSFLLPN